MENLSPLPYLHDIQIYPLQVSAILIGILQIFKYELILIENLFCNALKYSGTLEQVDWVPL